MSTKAPLFRPRRPAAATLILTACAALCACTAGPPEGPARRFGDLRLGGPTDTVPPPITEIAGAPSSAPASALAPALRPRLAAPAEPAPVLPVGLDAAAARISTYLTATGFALEQRPDGAGRLLSATRMGAPRTLEAEAVCGLEALHRPDIASTELTVRLTPAPGGVQLEASAHFVEVDTRLLSGELARQTCRSRGVLEAAIRRAALAG